MNDLYLTAFETEASRKLDRCVAARTAVAVTGAADGQGAWMAARLSRKGQKRVLLITSNELKAGKAADDAAQWLGASAMLLPAGELDLTRGASSHESAWRRLETLCGVSRGEASVLCVSA